MKRFNNYVQYQAQMELDERYSLALPGAFTVRDSFIDRLGLVGELEGHQGCVNCLEWSYEGDLLASGSDDVHVNIWNPFTRKLLTMIHSTHHGNIFSVKFVPNTGNKQIISGAADFSILLHEIGSETPLRTCTCHVRRVKRLVTDVTSPHLFWSAAEDGYILQHDIREAHVCVPEGGRPSRVLVDLSAYMGVKAEAKCLALNPVRPELIAVGANDPYVRLYDRRAIRNHALATARSATTSSSPRPDWDDVEENVWFCGKGEPPRDAITYLVPGHLPSKMKAFRKKHRSLASTYIEFSPDGKDLLVNLGGEQIYLFPLTPDAHRPSHQQFIVPNVDKTVPSHPLNGYKSPANGYKPDSHNLTPKVNGVCKSEFPPVVAALKAEANLAFDTKKFSRAIELYNRALQKCPNSAILYGNRGAALMKRGWDGDIYSSLRDCTRAVTLDPSYSKAQFRMIRCLLDLERPLDASAALNSYKQNFPKLSHSCKNLESELEEALKAIRKSPTPPRLSSSSSSASGHSPGEASSNSSGLRSSRSFFLRFSSSNSSSMSSNGMGGEDGEVQGSSPTSPPLNEVVENGDGNSVPDEMGSDHEESVASSELDVNMDNSDESQDWMTVSSNHSSSSQSSVPSLGPAKRAKLGELEVSLMTSAIDFTERYCGHCNSTTDIKEANFFGNYIVAGSDDGSIFIWDRFTTNIVRVMKGDDSIVNCIQPHPSTCLLATSGIENVIRLWEPWNLEKGEKNSRVIEDWEKLTSTNQKRMNTNPFEVILMNMGYQINSDGEQEDDSDEDEVPPPSGRGRRAHAGIQCNPT